MTAAARNAQFDRLWDSGWVFCFHVLSVLLLLLLYGTSVFRGLALWTAGAQ